jgi:NADH-quinone oxidoreductase subunit N
MYNNEFPIPSIDFRAILPMVIVMVTGIVALIVEIARPKQNNNPIVGVTLLGLVAAAFALFGQLGQAPSETLAGMVTQDQFGILMQLLLVVACFLCVMFSEGYLREKRIPFGEFYPLVLWSTSGAMLMATSKNLLVIFLGLEVLSIALYVMAGMSRSEEKSEESAVKYFLLGAFASGFLLYGIAFFYGATGSLRVDDMSRAWAAGGLQGHTLLLFGLGLMLVGFSFKSAFVPFHQWTPDVYQGAPTNVTAFMAAGSKIAAIAALFRVLEASTAAISFWLPAMTVIAVLTMTVGNLVALMQKDVKRILGYSSIAHAGYILVAVLAHSRSVANPEAYGSIGFGTTVYYLFSYALMTIGAFAVISLVAKSGRERTTLEDLHGLFHRDPAAAVMLVIFMASLIGIPPTSGFFGKLLIFNDALGAQLNGLALVLAVNSIISISYYLAIAKAAFVAEEGSERTVAAKMSPGLAGACTLCAIGVFAIAIFTGSIMEWSGSAGMSSQAAARLRSHRVVALAPPPRGAKL